MQRSVKFSAKLNNLIAGISDRITQQIETTRAGRGGGEALPLLSLPPSHSGFSAEVEGVARLLSASPREEIERESETYLISNQELWLGVKRNFKLAKIMA